MDYNTPAAYIPKHWTETMEQGLGKGASGFSATWSAIDEFGEVNFQNKHGIFVNNFLELLKVYLESTEISHQEGTYVQKAGICIGSAVAPVLSDILLAAFDQRLKDELSHLDVVRTFRYVDEYLIVLGKVPCERVQGVVKGVLEVFNRHSSGLKFTHEMLVENEIQFLDLWLSVEEQLFAAVAEFVSEATLIERALQQRSLFYDHHPILVSASAPTLPSDTDALRELVCSVVREELTRLQRTKFQPLVTSLSDIVHEKVHQAAQQFMPVRPMAASSRLTCKHCGDLPSPRHIATISPLKKSCTSSKDPLYMPVACTYKSTSPRQNLEKPSVRRTSDNRQPLTDVFRFCGQLAPELKLEKLRTTTFEGRATDHRTSKHLPQHQSDINDDGNNDKNDDSNIDDLDDINSNHDDNNDDTDDDSNYSSSKPSFKNGDIVTADTLITVDNRPITALIETSADYSIMSSQLVTALHKRKSNWDGLATTHTPQCCVFQSRRSTPRQLMPGHCAQGTRSTVDDLGLCVLVGGTLSVPVCTQRQGLGPASCTFPGPISS
ncbi:hypothetical protein HPB51_012686 [Rhipicephalus microplus]|uniref:Reverse transcriptase domain-containing protein n=1 Tax=Rhipicephalus microplus TaxID=6941 RepID=A0A9J6D530_RHIMP|nr:hypothetical protein HPB51_012686 [Rhipicephalus microplus]